MKNKKKYPNDLILLVNDDGVFARGLRVLADTLSAADYVIQVVAPDRDCSGASSSLTLQRPLQSFAFNDFLAINGTPSDCGHLGAQGVFGFSPGRIISGINAGANLGDDVVYSGTVAAAIEGRYLPNTSMAVSLCGDIHFETAGRCILWLLEQFCYTTTHLPHRTILNINIPDVPLAEIAGFEVTRLGRRDKATKPQTLHTPRGDIGYWLGDVGAPADKSLGTDFYAIEHKKISITPLHTDLTHYSAFDALAQLSQEQLLHDLH